MAGTRKYRSVDEDTTRVTIAVPKEVATGACEQPGSGVGPMMGQRIVERLREVAT